MLLGVGFLRFLKFFDKVFEELFDNFLIYFDISCDIIIKLQPRAVECTDF